MLREWEHPLLRQVLSCLSAARPPRSAAAAADAVPLDDAPGMPPMAADDLEPPPWDSRVIVDAATAATALPLEGGAVVTADSSAGGEEAPAFRGATGRDRLRPATALPRFALLQLAQCVLLASAAGEADLVALLPEHLRRSCGAAWRGAQPRPPLLL